MTSLGILGTGMIGSSIGLKARSLGWRVRGCDLRAENARTSHRLGALDTVVYKPEDLYRQSDIVVLATHLDGTLHELARLKKTPAECELVIDVSSVKTAVAQAATQLGNFVATHPLAGRELSGPEAGDASLFNGRKWVYIPTGLPALDGRACDLVRALGSLPLAMSAKEHDEAVALTSHLPQLISYLFASRLRCEQFRDRSELISGPVAKELVRLSGSGRDMWREILCANGTEIAREARTLADSLLTTANALERGDTAPF